MAVRSRLAGAALALLLGAAACQEPPSNTGAGPEGSASPSRAGHDPTSSHRPEPNSEATPGHEPYKEAAEKFALPKERIDRAVVAIRVEMVTSGGTAGEKLPGGFFNPAILRLFTDRLGVPADRARAVLDFLIEEWKEYDEEAEQRNPGVYARWNAYVALHLNISVDRARWLGSLLISRPDAGGVTDDPVFLAVARSVGVTPQRLATVVDGLKGGT